MFRGYLSACKLIDGRADTLYCYFENRAKASNLFLKVKKLSAPLKVTQICAKVHVKSLSLSDMDL